MAKLWEDTVVTALRDAQWRKCQGRWPNSAAPPGFLKLDGNAESALGDLFYSSADDRYFLIEVKSSKHEIRSEWGMGDSEAPKKSYSALASRWSSLFQAADDKDAGEIESGRHFFISSIACHHFAYWDSWDIGGVTFGDVVITPYVAACLREFSRPRNSSGPFIKKLGDNYFMVGKQIGDDNYYSETVSINFAFDEKSKVYVMGSGGNIIADKPLGLKLDKFKEYINDLAVETGSDDAAIHGVVMSSSGRVFELVSSIAELSRLFCFDVERFNALKSNPQKLTRAPKRKFNPNP